MNLLNSGQVAERLGISIRRVQALAHSRNIGQLVAGRFVFREADLIKFEDRKPGRPKRKENES